MHGVTYLSNITGLTQNPTNTGLLYFKKRACMLQERHTHMVDINVV